MSRDAALDGAGWIKLLARLERGAGAAAEEFSRRHPGRWQDPVIVKNIPRGASVLDLGCGHGELLERLQREREARVQGVELDFDEVAACIARGVPVLQADVDDGLKEFPSDRFDFVVLEETLQTLYCPGEVLAEMLRVGRTCIVSFPNFGYWQVRLDLLMRGRMPVTKSLRHSWYDTPNIHNLSLQDFIGWIEDHDAVIDRGYTLGEEGVRPLQDMDLLHAAEVMLFFRRKPASKDTA